jgi:hypothetical protein
VRVTHLRLDGRNRAHLPSPTVNAGHVTFARDSVTNHNEGAGGGEIGFLVGSLRYGRADHFRAVHDIVHNVGDMATATDENAPGGFYEHAFYLEASRHWLIANCIIYTVSGRGIQLYPHAGSGRAVHNLIDGSGTGVIFDGTSSRDVFRRNIVVGSFVLGLWYFNREAPRIAEEL